ncbi:MAG: YbaK/EbsC family protein [Alphaproteobacteria bacterium]|nr:YbaK/EbsC family protein [Alphaproteobacteria bacterium]
MSKSLNRVKAHLSTLGLSVEILEITTPTNTAAQAAEVVGCAVDQIAKSVIFRGETSGKAVLFLTAGGSRVDVAAASELAQEPLGKADAAMIRQQTGFAIGGVSPFGHLNPIEAFMDKKLLRFATIWAAAGTPHHMFEMSPQTMRHHTGALAAEFTE